MQLANFNDGEACTVCSVSQSVTSCWVSGRGVGVGGGWRFGLDGPSSVPVSAEGVLTVGGAVPLRRRRAAVVWLWLRVWEQGGQQLWNKTAASVDFTELQHRVTTTLLSILWITWFCFFPLATVFHTISKLVSSVFAAQSTVHALALFDC